MAAFFMQVAGLAAIAVGCFLIAPAAGFIAAGIGTLALGIAMERG